MTERLLVIKDMIERIKPKLAVEESKKVTLDRLNGSLK